jgi:hypothetical protein
LIPIAHRTSSIPLGVVIRKSPGVTRWAKWVWMPVSVLPGAAAADWKVLREDGACTEYHAATVTLELHASEAEAYLNGLSAQVPSIYIVLREAETGEFPYDVLMATASPYEAQYYAGGPDDIVEKVPMTEGLIGWVNDFVQTHHEEEVFVKRQRDKTRTDLVEDGIGDARIAQVSDVYRAPSRTKKAIVH